MYFEASTFTNGQPARRAPDGHTIHGQLTVPTVGDPRTAPLIVEPTDASVRWVGAEINLSTFLSIASYNGGEAVGDF